MGKRLAPLKKGLIAPFLFRCRYDSTGSVTTTGLLDQAVTTALTSVANGMAKNTPQKPHNPPNTKTAMMM